MSDLVFHNHIILDRFNSYPQEILDLIDNHANELRGFLNEEHRIDKLAEENLEYRHRRPENSYETIWNDIVAEIENNIRDRDFIGFHCSRLLDFEITDILSSGLRPLETVFSNVRVQRLYDSGFIGDELKNNLMNKTETRAPNRRNKIWFFHSTATLKEEHGLIRLFKSWGGEAIYLNFEEKTELQNLGKPCIVVASLKRQQLTEYFRLPERMICIRLNDVYRSKDFDTFLEANRVRVLRIIAREEILFDELTDIKSWHTPVE